MKKTITALILTLALLLTLTACGAANAAPYSITDEFTQRYEYRDLIEQRGLFRAVANADLPAEVGLRAGTNRLTVAYTHPTAGEFWLECYALNATEAAMVREREMPFGEWLTNAETPENRAELILEAADGMLYAAALCSRNIDEESMMGLAESVVLWLPGDEDPTVVYCPVPIYCIDGSPIPCAIPTWEQSGDAVLTDGTLTLRTALTQGYRGSITADGTWRLQRLTNGRWYDMDQQGEGLQHDDTAVWGTVELELPTGEYRLMLNAVWSEGQFTEMPYVFRVG